MSIEDDVVNSLVSQQHTTAMQVVGDIDANPDDAARSVQLAEATGIAPSIINGDLENFSRSYKSQLATDIIRNNEYISDYVSRNPIASKLSNDDYGQLDAVSEAIQKLPWKYMIPPVAFGQAIQPETSQVLHETWEGVKHLGEIITGQAKPNEQEQQVLGAVEKSLTNSGMSPQQIQSELRTIYGRMQRGEALQTILFSIPTAISSPAIGAFRHFISQPVEQQTGFPKDLTETLSMSALMAIGIGTKLRSPGNQVVAEHYINSGKEPPRFLDPEIDTFKYHQNEVDLKGLDEAIKEAQTSATKERSPEIFQSFIESHTDAKIGISGDAVAKLYGDKVPVVDDGILGFVPNIEAQLESARLTGADIEVPLAAWVARVDPEVAKALRDDTRVRPGAITKVEKEALGEIKLGEPIDPVTRHETLRDLAGLEPMLSMPERKLELKRVGTTGRKITFRDDVNFHDFEFIDQDGKPAGYLMISEEKGGKSLYIEDISATIGDRGEMGNAFGPRLVRDLLRQIKEQFPNAEEIRGHRVSGARDKAGTWESHGMAGIKLSVPEGWGHAETTNEFNRILEGGSWNPIAPGYKAYVKPKEAYVGKEAELVAKIDEELQRIAPQAGRQVAEKITAGAQGLHWAAGLKRSTPSLITLSMEAPDPVGVGYHEAIHHLRNRGLFTAEEWTTLAKASEDGKWLEKFDIEGRYSERQQSAKIEESVAEAFREWRNGKLEVDGVVAKVFEKLKEIVERISYALKQTFGKEITFDDVFEAIDRGQVGRRREFSSPTGDTLRDKWIQQNLASESRPPIQLDLGQDLTRMEDRQPFSGIPGMTKPQIERYQKLIAKRLAEDTDHIEAKAIADEKRRQTKEWKENEVPIRAAVVAEYKNKPEVMADDFFRTSSLYGEKLDSRPRLDADLLTPEQKAALPERFYKEDGIHPDDAAGLFGYPDGKSMVDSLIAFNLERVASALRPDEFARRQIGAEVNRRMERLYGNLRENIMEEVKDRVASETQFDILHEEVYALASEAKAEFTFTKDQLKEWAANDVKSASLWSLSSDTYFSNAGKAGRLAEDALLKGKYAEAFREKQRQMLNMLLAKEAIKVEKEYNKFEKVAKRFSRREVNGIDGEFTDYIQALLAQAEIPGQRSVPELQAALDARGGKSLSQFTDAKIAEGWEPAVSAEILQRGAKPLDKMTVGEFQDFKASIDSLAHIGKAVNEIMVAGKKMEFNAVKQDIRDHLKQLPKRPADSNKLRLGLDASLVRMEQLAKDLDLHEELGPFFNHVIRPIQEAKSVEYSMLDKLAARISNTPGADRKWQKTLKDTIPQDFLYDAFNETKVPMTRESMINIMLNFGNDSNIAAFTRGWVQNSKQLTKKQLDVAASQLEMRLRMLFDRYATKADWDYTQHMWDTFGEWRDQSAELSRQMSGVPSKFIEAKSFKTPHGDYAGGYFPIIYDPIRSGISETKSDGGTFGGNYYRATTNQGHLKQRVYNVDVVKFDNTIEELGARMMQVIHDISHRQAIMDVGKIIYDKEIMADIRKYYGQEYEPQFDKWLKDVANHTNLDERAIARWNSVLKGVRMNLVNHALGLNLRVLGSPSLGTQNPLGIARDMVMKRWDPEMKNFAMENSLELKHTARNLDRDYREALENNIEKQGWKGVQAQAARWAFTPIMKVEEGLRVNTWVDKFQEAVSNGHPKDDAIALADSAVRIRHGASGVADLPAIMRHQNEMMKTLTMFYGYFNTTYNWQREIPGAVRRGDWQQTFAATYGAVVVPAFFGALFFNQQKESDSWWKVMGKALLLQPVQSIPGMREFGNYFLEGFPPRTPLESLMTAMNSMGKDVINFLDRKPVKKPIQHTANVVGMATGLPLAQVGRTGQFAADVAQDRQRPSTFAEWARGIVNGEAKLKR